MQHHHPLNSSSGGLQQNWYPMGVQPEAAAQQYSSQDQLNHHLQQQQQQQHQQQQYSFVQHPAYVDAGQYWAYPQHQPLAAHPMQPYFGHPQSQPTFVHSTAAAYPPNNYQQQMQAANNGAPLYYVTSPAGGGQPVGFVPFLQSVAPPPPQLQLPPPRDDAAASSTTSVPGVGANAPVSSPLLTSGHQSVGSPNRNERPSPAQHQDPMSSAMGSAPQLPQPLRLARFMGTHDQQQQQVHSPLLASMSTATDDATSLTFGSTTANLPPASTGMAPVATTHPPVAPQHMPPFAAIGTGMLPGDHSGLHPQVPHHHQGAPTMLGNSMSHSNVNVLSVTANNAAYSQTLPRDNTPSHGDTTGTASVPQNTQVMVNYLDPIVNAQELNGLFRHFGATRGAKIIYDNGNQSRGYGFVYFCEADAARKAVVQADGMVHRGKRLRVHFSNKPNPSFS